MQDIPECALFSPKEGRGGGANDFSRPEKNIQDCALFRPHKGGGDANDFPGPEKIIPDCALFRPLKGGGGARMILPGPEKIIPRACRSSVGDFRLLVRSGGGSQIISWWGGRGPR